MIPTHGDPDPGNRRLAASSDVGISPRSELEAWTAYYREAEQALELASDRQIGLWISEHRISEHYLELTELTKQARSRFEAHLIAYNAFMDQKKTPNDQVGGNETPPQAYGLVEPSASHSSDVHPSP